MVGLELDTTPSQVERYYDLLRQMSPAARLRAASAATRRVRLFAEAGLRQRFPDADDGEIRIRLTALLYGREAAMRVHGNIPEDVA